MKLVSLIVFVFLNVLCWGQIRVDEPVKELGEIFEKRGSVKTSFRLSNPYFNDTLRIIDVETSCGCTAILTEDTIIMPRSSIDMEIMYDPAGRLGLFVKSIEVTSGKNSNETSKLFLKIMGNVVAENYSTKAVNTDLVEYEVAPIYFYPISPFDTAYLDFSYVSTFINDLSFEVDFYQFTTVGAEIEVRGYDQIEQLEDLLKFTQDRLIKGFQRRGFTDRTTFFDEPVFKLNEDIPAWAAASIRLYSVNFDATDKRESNIKVTSDEVIEQSKVLLDYTRFAQPEIEEIVGEINAEAIEGKLFLNGELNLKGFVLTPWKKTDKENQKFVRKLEKEVFKMINSTTGAGKNEISVSFDSIAVHPSDKYQFVLWDTSDEQLMEKIKYEIKPENITAPLLPTYRQEYDSIAKLDTSNYLYKQFIESCVEHGEFNDTLNALLVLTYNKSSEKGKQLALQNSKLLKHELEAIYSKKTGRNLVLEVKTLSRGFSQRTVLISGEEITPVTQNNYFTIVPLVNQRSETTVPMAKPYMVNFDYYFKGIDTKGWGFKQFSNYINAAVIKNGFVELRIESSISNIPIQFVESNLILAYERLIESENRLKKAMSNQLIDPNRILFKDELIVQQGPDYDGTIPILKYREFHYIRIISEESLK